MEIKCVKRKIHISVGDGLKNEALEAAYHGNVSLTAFVVAAIMEKLKRDRRVKPR